MGLDRLKQEAPLALPDELVASLSRLGIDTAFVLAPEHRPSSKSSAAAAAAADDENDIPVIDLAPLLVKDEDGITRIIHQVGAASEKWGFFQVINHGVPLELLKDLQVQAKEFFDSPLEEKRKIRRTDVKPMGYYDSELTKNTRDWKEVFDFVASDNVGAFDGFNMLLESQWPEGHPKLKELCQRWIREVQGLGYTVLELLALSLNLSQTHFRQFFGDEHTSVARLNYYRKCPVPDLVLGVSRHKDQGALTILVQDDVGGLEVRRKDGEWIRVSPRPEAFVVNLGDLMQVWTNDKYESVEHRVVVNENRDRFSCPFFMFPSYKADVAPIESLTGPENPPKYRPFNWGEFDKNRKDSNFKRLGVENLQIYHYAMDKSDK